MDDQDIPEEEHERLKKAMAVIGLLFNLWLLYEYYKEVHPSEVEIVKRKLRAWWHRAVVAPGEQVKKLRRMERETVVEAMMVVDDAGA